MNIPNFLRPNRFSLGLFLLLGLLFSVIPYGVYATTKATWEESHGIPFKFMQLSVCFGICDPRQYVVQDYDVKMLILDALIWYLIARTIAYGLSIASHNEKIRAIVMGKR